MADKSGDQAEEDDMDPELVMCLLQPSSADSDPDYIGISRQLLSRKSMHRRLDWRCNGKRYVAFHNYIWRPHNWDKDSLRTPSLQTTPGNSGRWIQSPSPRSLLYAIES